MAQTLKGGFSCFFAPDSTGISHCKYSALLGLGFAGAYCVTYVFGSALMKLASANYQGLVSAITNPLSGTVGRACLVRGWCWGC